MISERDDALRGLNVEELPRKELFARVPASRDSFCLFLSEFRDLKLE